MFISVEGLDRAGKDTQADRLAKHLGAHRLNYPDRSTPVGRIIDRWLKGAVTFTPVEDAPLALQALLLANKVEAQPRLAGYLRRNGRVVSARFDASTYAYGRADGVDKDWTIWSHDALIKPDLTVIIDITPEESFKRRGDRAAEHYEQNATRLARAREHYLDFARITKNSAVVNGMQSEEAVFAEIIAMVDRQFSVVY